MTEARPVAWPLGLLIGAVGGATALALVAGDPLVATGPVLLATVVWAALRLPLRATLSVVLLAVLTVDNPQERPAAGLWQSPLYPLGQLLFENLSRYTGIDALRLAVIDLLVLGMVLLAALRGPRPAPAGSPLVAAWGGSRPAGLVAWVLGLSLVGAVLLAIDPARFSLLCLLLFALAFLAVFRGARGPTEGGPEALLHEGTGPASALTWALVLSLGGLLLAEGWGLARGGDLKASLWQVRQLVAFPVLALLFVAAFREPREFATLGKLVICAAAVRTLEGLYFNEVICRPLNFRPPYVTTHSDTMLYVLALVLLAVFWSEARTRKSFWAMALAGPWILGGVYMNGRRLAYVSLAVALLAVFLLSPRTRLKLAIARAAVVSLPLVMLYVAAGWSSNAGVFRPAQMLKSVVTSKADRSTQTRDIENFNLVQTLKAGALLGTGFGHEYREVSRADDISRLFPQYRLIPHNSFLGLWAFAGLVGFWTIWLPLVVAVFLGVRSYPRARDPTERTLALVPVIMAIAFSVQAYGDMGLQSWGGAFLLAAALATAGRLSVSVGAWPLQQWPPRGIQRR